ncbi:carboxypeptidase-like regulatory domain-containing protein [Tenacibaculum xiamenense]|uniref:carboxypeptidase-like regulatory domain-containing protein n=1 Tax=Tenacibaculum xiamenense TaxID=1261553 RepID=UPI003894E05F
MHKKVLFLFFLSSHLIYSQRQNKIIKGVVTDEKGPVINAHIINLTTKQGTFSNDEGSFSIRASLGDELQISSVQHKTKIITIAKVIIKELKITVQLETKTNMLDEVIVKKHQLSGDLESDTKQTPTNYKEERVEKLVTGIKGMMSEISRMPVTIDEIDRSKPPVVGLPNQFQGAGFAPSIGGRKLEKERKRKKRLQQKQDFPDELLQELGIHFFVNELNIPKDKYYHFISFCELKNVEQLFRSKQIFKLIEVLKEESLIYLKEIED